MNESADFVAVAGALPQALLEGVGRQVGAQRSRAAPADDAPRIDVHDECDVHPARPGRDVGQVGDPQPVRGRGPEDALHQVIGAGVDRRGRDGGPLDLAAHRAGQAELAHQPLDLAARHAVAFALQGPPDLAGTVDAEVVLEDPLDLGLELLVVDRPG
jgi:hypothetical protein